MCRAWRKLVGGVRLRLRERIEQRGLAGVGIADEGDRHRAITRALTTLRTMLTAQLLEPGLERLDTLTDQPAVRFELRFARTAQANTALLPFQVSPRANEPCRQILQLCEFDLQFAFVAAGALRKDVEDEARAVHHAAVEREFEIAPLRGRECVIEDDEFDVVRFARKAQFFNLAAANEHLGVRSRTAAG